MKRRTAYALYICLEKTSASHTYLVTFLLQNYMNINIYIQLKLYLMDNINETYETVLYV